MEESGDVSNNESEEASDNDSNDGERENSNDHFESDNGLKMDLGAKVPVIEPYVKVAKGKTPSRSHDQDNSFTEDDELASKSD
jgi:hypothetical protein